MLTILCVLALISVEIKTKIFLVSVKSNNDLKENSKEHGKDYEENKSFDNLYDSMEIKEVKELMSQLKDMEDYNPTTTKVEKLSSKTKQKKKKKPQLKLERKKERKRQTKEEK